MGVSNFFGINCIRNLGHQGNLSVNNCNVGVDVLRLSNLSVNNCNVGVDFRLSVGFLNDRGCLSDLIVNCWNGSTASSSFRHLIR